MPSPVFRTTTYRIAAGDFDGLTMRLVLRYDLAENYFVMVNVGANENSSTAPDNYGVRVTGDPHGSGPLDQADGNWLVLERAASDEAGVTGTVTVVESLRDHDTAGFRLRGVEHVVHADWPNTTEQTGAHACVYASWVDPSRLVPFGGPRGGGTSTSGGTGTNDAPTLGLRWYPSGTGTLNWARKSTSTSVVEAAESTVYMVEWGSEWDVQRVAVSGNTGGSYVTPAYYTTGALTRSVDPLASWVWFTGWAEGVGGGDSWRALAATIGTGGTPPTSASTVAVTIGVYPTNWSTDVYVMSHPLLTAQWDLKPYGYDSSAYEMTVDAPDGWERRRAASDFPFSKSTEGGRFGAFFGGGGGTYSFINEAAKGCLPTASDTMTVYTSDQSIAYAWAGWLHTVDFGLVIVATESEPVFRVTQVYIDDSNTTPLDVELPHDLVENYFVMIEGTQDVATAFSPNTQFMRLSGDPFGTGDLDTSSAANVITLKKNFNFGNWDGVITVVESLRAHDTDGFRLRAVSVDTQAAAGALGYKDVQRFSVTFESAIENLDNVYVYTGPKGGGSEGTSGSTLPQQASYSIGQIANDGETLELIRYSSITSLLTSNITTSYIVEWGRNWTLQRARIDGYIDTTWRTVDVADFDAETTVMHAVALSFENEPYQAAWGISVVPGDGTTVPSGTLGTIAYRDGRAYTQAAYIDVVLMSHPNLAVNWAAVSLGLTDTSTTDTVDAPVRGEAYGTLDGNAYTVGERASMAWTWTNEATVGLLSSTVAMCRLTGFTTLTTVRPYQDGASGVDGWAYVADFGGITARVGGVGWEDESGAYGAVQGLVIRDRWLDAVTLTADESGGALPGPVLPEDGNAGSIYGFLEGSPSNSSTDWVSGADHDYVLRVVSGGGLNSEAGYARRKAGQADSKLAALNALTTLFHHRGPGGDEHWYAGSIAYSNKYNRLIVAMVVDDSTVQIWYKASGEHPQGDWSTVDVTVENADPGSGSPSEGQDVGLGLVEVSDGSLVMMLNTISDDGSRSSVDQYRSTDGGLTWSKTLSNLVQPVTNTTWTSGRGSWVMSSSGDYVRIVFLEYGWFSGATTGDVETWVSPDRGASWTELEAIQIRTWATPSSAGRWAHAMVGLGDQSGTFMFLGIYQQTVRVWISSGTDDWVLYSALELDFTGVGYALALWAVRGPDRIWVWALGGDNSSASQMMLWTVDPADITDSDNWSAWPGSMGTLEGSADWVPYATKGVWAGDMMVLFGSNADISDTSKPNTVKGCALVTAGGWDQSPWSFSRDIGSIYTNWMRGSYLNTMTRAWWPWTGPPQGGAGSGWTWTTTGATTVVRGDYTQSTATSSSSGHWDLNDGGVPSDEGWNQGALHFVCQVVAERAGTSTAALHMGARLTSNSASPAGEEYSIEIRMTTTGFLVYDLHGSATLYDGSSDYSTAAPIVEWRVAKGGKEIRWREITSDAMSDDDWNTTGELSPTSSANPGQNFEVGIIVGGGTSGTSVFRFYEWVEYYRTPIGQNVYALTLPQDLSGSPMTPGGLLLGNGLTVRWGGAGAFSGDEYLALTDYTRGAENLLEDSPRMMWESVTTGEASIVLRAGTSDTLTGARWEADTVFLVGTVDRTCEIAFADTNDAATWASPPETVELTADLYTDLVVVDVNGSAVQLSSASGVLPPPGTAAELFLRFTNSGSESGETHRVRQDPDAGDGWFQLDGEAAAEGVYAIGSTCVIFMDRMIYRGTGFYRYKYARITFPDVSSVGTVTEVDGSRAGGTATGTHRLGTMVLGHWVPFDVPVDWTFTDDEQPNTTEGRTKGAVTWAHQEGPSQRTVTGRIVGDVDEFRTKLRNLLGKYHGFNVAPAGLVLDGRNPSPDRLLLVKWESGSQQDEAGWYQDEDGVWRTAGDADIVCVEVV